MKSVIVSLLSLISLTLQPGYALTPPERLRALSDQGEGYRLADGRFRPLPRLAGSVFIQIDNPESKEAVIEELTERGGILQDFAVEPAGDPKCFYLAGSLEMRQAHQANPVLLTDQISAARAVDRVILANQVFLSSEGYRMVALDELMVRLKPGTDPVRHFGADWPNVRQVTRDQYSIRHPGADSSTILEEVNARSSHPEVLWVEPVFLMDGEGAWTAPNDPEWPYQWGLQTTAGVDIQTAWDRTRGAGATIAILDVGTQLDHSDLAGNLSLHDDRIEEPGVDDDGNGYIDDTFGWDFHFRQPTPPVGAPDGDNDPGPTTADDNHGTIVAGAAVATTFNGAGVAGTAPDAKLLIVRIAQANPQPGNPNQWAIFSDRLAEGIRYAAGERFPSGTWNGADVINMSFSTAQNNDVDSALSFAHSSGRGGLGAILVTASGNSASGWVWTSHKLAVTATAGTYTFRWEYAKDGADSDPGDADTVWLDQVMIPEAASPIEAFEQAGLPTGWSTTGAASWSVVQDGVSGNHAITGIQGESAVNRSVRSGAVTHSQTSSIQKSQYLASPAGEYVSFYRWVSTETGDNLNLHITSAGGYSETVAVGSGIPDIRTEVGYPAKNTYVIAVGGSSTENFRVDYSQFDDNPVGKTVDFVAPTHLGGTFGIATTDREGSDGYASGDYTYAAGTSISSPIAAGVAGLLVSYKPSLTDTAVRYRLSDTASKIGSLSYSSGKNPQYGSGRLDARRAVAQGAIDLAFDHYGAGADGTIYTVAAHDSGQFHGTLIGGSFSTVNGQSRPYLARLYAQNGIPGQLYTSFAPSIPGTVLALAVQSDQKVLVGMGASPYLVRLNSDGSTDTGFSPTLDGTVRAILLDGGGNIYIGGDFGSVNGTSKPKLARLTSAGALDNSSYWFYFNINGSVSALGMQADGKILIGGSFTSIYTYPSWYTRNYLARISSDGAIDTGFGNTGLNGGVWCIGLLSDASIVAGGAFNGSSNYPDYIARFNASGTSLWSPLSGSGANNQIYSLLVNAEDEILIGGGFTTVNGTTANRVARLSKYGILDSYFDVTGGPNSTIYSLTFPSAARQVFAAGAFSQFNGASQGRLARLHGE